MARRSTTVLLSHVTTCHPSVLSGITVTGRHCLSPAILPSRHLRNDPSPFARQLIACLRTKRCGLLGTCGTVATRRQQRQLIGSVASIVHRSLSTARVFRRTTARLNRTLGIYHYLVCPYDPASTAIAVRRRRLRTAMRSLLKRA